MFVSYDNPALLNSTSYYSNIQHNGVIDALKVLVLLPNRHLFAFIIAFNTAGVKRPPLFTLSPCQLAHFWESRFRLAGSSVLVHVFSTVSLFMDKHAGFSHNSLPIVAVLASVNCPAVPLSNREAFIDLESEGSGPYHSRLLAAIVSDPGLGNTHNRRNCITRRATTEYLSQDYGLD